MSNRTKIIGLLSALVFCLLAQGICWANEDKSTITVQGTADLSFPPDQVELTLGVRNQALTAQKAVQENAQAMTGVIKALKDKLGPKDNLTTSGFSLHAKHDWDRKTNQKRFLGFEASNQVSITSKKINQVGMLLDLAVKAGANDISGPYWSIKNPVKAKSKAQVQAFERAKIKAKALAKASGLALGKVLKISAGAPMDYRMPQANLGMHAKMAAGETPVSPGLIKVNAQVTCVFELK